MQIGDIFFAFRGDSSVLIKDASAAGDKAGAGFAGPFGKHFDKLTKHKGFQTVTQGVGLGVGVGLWGVLGTAIGGATSLIFDSIKASSDLNEQVNKSQAIFGDSSAAVQAFGDTSAAAFGISKREALEAAGNFGNLFNTIGLAGDVSSEMSTKLVGLAADLASFNNIDPGVALEKLRAGLSGEAEPLRTVGVLLNESTVAAEASALGFKKVNGQFTEGAKVQARYALILKQTTTAQGDFANTGDSMANMQRKLNAQLEDTTAELGARLVPVVQTAQELLLNLISAGTASTESAAEQLLTTERQAVAGNRNALAALAALGIGMEQARADIESAAKRAADIEGQEFRRGEREVHGAMEDVKDDVGDGMSYVTGRVGAMAAAIQTDLNAMNSSVRSGFSALTESTKNTFTDKQLRDILAGKGSMGRQLQKGLHDARPEVRQAAEKIRKDMEDILSARAVIIKINYDRSGVGRFLAAGGPLDANEGAWVGERGPEYITAKRDVYVHAADSVVSRAAAAADRGASLSPAAMARGENHFHYTITVEGPVRVRTPFELSDTLRRYADFGILTPRRRAFADE